MTGPHGDACTFMPTGNANEPLTAAAYRPTELPHCMIEEQ